MLRIIYGPRLKVAQPALRNNRNYTLLIGATPPTLTRRWPIASPSKRRYTFHCY